MLIQIDNNWKAGDFNDFWLVEVDWILLTECIEKNILADFLRKNRTEAIEVSIFEYDEKREKELIRKAEFAEGERIGRETGVKEGMDRIFEINRLFKEKYTEKQIAEKMGLDEQEVRKILERLNSLG